MGDRQRHGRKMLDGGYQLKNLGHIDSDFSYVISEATSFLAACYGSKERDNMTAVRFVIWSQKMGNKKLTAAPQLKSLPPTTAAFTEHVHRAPLQAAVWHAALEADPPAFQHTHGWTTDQTSNTLVPIPLPPNVTSAPDEVLKMIRCGCRSVPPCATAKCSCSAAKPICLNPMQPSLASYFEHLYRRNVKIYIHGGHIELIYFCVF